MLNHTNTLSKATMMTLTAGLIATTACMVEDEDLDLGHGLQHAVVPNAVVPNAVVPNAVVPNAVVPNGASTADYTFNGFSFNAASTAGLSVAGQGIDAVALDGLTVNGGSTSGVTVNGLALTADQEDSFDMLAAYLANCALSDTQSITIISSTGEAKQYNGGLELAPEWATGALTDHGKRAVSACIAARSNSNGQRVLVSLRNSSIPLTATELATFKHPEGAFWGNVFGDAPFVNSCSAQGSGVAGRNCTDGQCYFVDAGDCASVCAGQNATDGSFENCDGNTAIITTFLPATTRDSFNGNHSCTVAADGSLSCSGDNREGQLGNGTTQNSNDATAVSFAGDAAVVEIANGKKHSCARQKSGTVRCWGKNKDGQAGIGSSANKILAPSTDVPLIQDAMSLRSGSDHVCVLEADGTVLCWGKNKDGQLGDGSHHNSDVPAVVGLTSEALYVAAGNSSKHSCAIIATGELACWGKNKKGQLGDDSHHNRATPIVAQGLENVTGACTGKQFTCALDANGEVFCFGKINNSDVPAQVTLAQTATAISCSKEAACATLADGSEQCW